MSDPGHPALVEHLFRHQYGKYVAILTRLFGVAHLAMIEDAVQDTFLKASLAWRHSLPEHPEAWLTTAAKRRTIDLFRRVRADEQRLEKLELGDISATVDEVFLDDQIADAQLRMLFTACHPALSAPDQLAFALRTVSGFSQAEIAAALLARPETIKKRLTRARREIIRHQIAFVVPQGGSLPARLDRVLQVLYLIFNEGFHSTKREVLIRRDLCGEAMRLCRLVLMHPLTQKPDAHALFALMCFHAARLDTKIDDADEIIDLRHQDRNRWHQPLILLGHRHMELAVDTDQLSNYHYEAAIAHEHVKATAFAKTDWDQLAHWYGCLQALSPTPLNLLNLAVVEMHAERMAQARAHLTEVDPAQLGARRYLYHGCWAEWHRRSGDSPKARESLTAALACVSNDYERAYLERKLVQLD